MHDMVPRNQRSIRDIPVSTQVKKREAARERAHSIEEDYTERPSRPLRPRRKSRRMFFVVALVVVIACGVVGLLLSTLFAGATVSVFPRTEQVTAPATLIANLNAPTGELSYQTMTVSRSASTTVAASGTHQVSRSASGVITIYNNFSVDPQRLIANTRFAAPDGKIYRIHDSVVIPGATKKTDGSLTAGTVTATVYADSPGAAYNRTQTRFTIPGFQGDPRYDKFYAETNAISGGFVGTEPAVAQADLTQAAELIKQGLTQAAQSSLAAQVPPGYLVVPGSLAVDFGTVSQTPGQGNTATIAQTATMTGAIVRISDLAMAVAHETVQNYGGEQVAFEDASTVSVAAATSTKAGGSLTLMLSGTPTLVWQFDSEALTQALVGKNKSTFESVIESFAPAITRADAKVRPFWQRNFPSDPEKIIVVTTSQ